MSTTWKSLEDYVRQIAELRWHVPCKPEHIDGVDFDGVSRISPDEIVLIEITKERTLQKVRDDLNKIKPTKLRLATEGLICRGFIILEEEPTASMIEAGQTSHIKVCSAQEFQRSFFDFLNYDSLRNRRPFGSAVDSKTGANDLRGFIPVSYTELEKDKIFKIENIAKSLQRGNNIILTGDYGAGKSRCISELYQLLKLSIRESAAFPIAIDLRDHWSSSSALEILAGHLGNIGLSNSVDNIIKLLNCGNLILLLDGFDEIGTQIHDTRIEDRRALRKKALQGVRDLIQRSKARIIITGRSHFFDGTEEMIESLGLSSNKDLICLEVPENFSTAEGTQYLNALGINVPIPEWLPRKPLVFQMLVELEAKDVTSLLCNKHGQFEFWATFIGAVCRRESKGVGESIAPLTIMLILQQLAAKTRYTKTFRGRLTPTDIDSAYQSVVGSVPDQSGRQLLSRMCTLGRIEPESPDRQFIDTNVLDILRAESLVSNICSMVDGSENNQWIQSLQGLGIIHAARMVKIFDLVPLCFSFLNKFSNSQNTKRLGEIVSLLTMIDDEALDFKFLHINQSNIPMLNLSNKSISNLSIKNSEIGILIIEATPIKIENCFSITDCIISNVFGVSTKIGFPDWIKDTEAINFERLSNASRIKESILNPAQKVFLSIIHKIFFQPGSGREEASLSKGGYGQKYTPALAESVIKLLLKNGLISSFKGNDGMVYTPIRRFTNRMDKIRSELTLSQDSIWLELSNFK